MIFRDRDYERFVEKFSQEDGKCWLWFAGKNKQGYGQFYLQGKNMLAHRVSYEVFAGKIPDGLCVLHKCDVPSCVRPDHLYIGTQKDNTQDMIRKGRDRNQHAGKTSCFRGHEFTVENTRTNKAGSRHCLECRKEYNKKNKESISEYNREHHCKNKGRLNEYNREYRCKNKERINELQRIRRAKKKAECQKRN